MKTLWNLLKILRASKSKTSTGVSEQNILSWKSIQNLVRSLEFINSDAINEETNPGAKSDIYRLEESFKL